MMWSWPRSFLSRRWAKGSRKNKFPCLGAETPVWQGARTAHTPWYGKDEQRRQTGWIDAQTWEVILAGTLATLVLGMRLAPGAL